MSISIPTPLVVLPDGSLDANGVQSDLTQLAQDANPDPGGWQDVTSFLNGWVNYDATRPARFYLDRGRVYLEGVIKSGSLGNAAFTLPLGFRHDRSPRLTFAVNSNDAYGCVYVEESGDVIPAVGSVLALDLSGVSFRIA